MRVTRICTAWLADLIEAADAPIPTLVVSLSDGDEMPPDKISVVWSEDVDPVAPPLHLYDMVYEISVPSGSNLTPDQIATVEAWIAAQLADEDNFDDLATALEDVGTLNDWFIGTKGDVERRDAAVITRREIRLAVVHG
jgi:hypothetical protein